MDDNKHVRGERTMKNGLTQAEIEFVELLTPGDTVEVFNRRSILLYRGVVEEAAPPLGVVWIRTESAERRMFDVREHLVRKLPGPEAFYSIPLP